MQIHARTVYSIGGIDFDSEAKARAWIYDQIGGLMDSALASAGAGALGPRERIQIVDAITANAATLAVLLDAYRGPVDS